MKSLDSYIFNTMNRLIYLDHNATTPVRPEVLEAMMPYLTERYGNASSLHAHGRWARDAVESAREQVASLLGAKSSEIVFTSGGTESDNFALVGVLRAGRGMKRLVTTAIEHHAVLETARALERQGFEAAYVGVDRFGNTDVGALRDALRDDTALVSVMHANNEVGTVQPIAEIAPFVRERGILLHTDAVQTTGKIPFTVDSLGVDLLSLSAHKIGGPKGVGALYVRRGTKMHRFHQGGQHERNRRGGTENVPGIVGLGKAAELALTEMESEGERLRGLTAHFLAEVRRLDGFVVNSPENRTPGTVHISFERAEGETLILGLDLEGICVSSGSACASGSMEPSHVLAAMGLPPELAQGTVRFSFGHGNTEADAEAVVEALEGLLKRMRKGSI